jgi:alpha-beta hydrolase superfamily lysophospholipase
MHRMMSFRIVALVAALGAIVATSMAARAQVTNEPDEVVKIDGLDVALWRPPASRGPKHLVLFSHGVLGCKTQSGYLMRKLAQEGFLVAAPDHRDNRCNRSIIFAVPRIARLFRNPHTWTDDTYRDRRDDLYKLRDGLLADPTYAALLNNPDRVALVGHSLGGYTVLALAGARGSRKMDGIAGVVVLAPFVAPFQHGGTPENISVPVLVQAGEVDRFAEPTPLNEVYPRIPSPACKVIYRGADHFAWVDPAAFSPFFAWLAQPKFRDDAAAAAIAFLKDVFAPRRPTSIPPSPQTTESRCK